MFVYLIVLASLFINIIIAEKGHFLEYDVECPFLNNEEYAKRMIKGRCPATSPTPPSTTTSPKPKNASRLSLGSKRMLLKFVSMGKAKLIEITLVDQRISSATLMEGAFLIVHCTRPVNASAEDKIKWFFNGELIADSLRSWRIWTDDESASLSVMPVLAGNDDGNFECFMGKEWRGGLRLSVETIFEAILFGYLNFLLGSFFTFLFSIGAGVYFWFHTVTPTSMISN